MPVHGRVFGEQLCELFDLDATQIRQIVLHASVSDVAVIVDGVTAISLDGNDGERRAQARSIGVALCEALGLDADIMSSVRLVAHCAEIAVAEARQVVDNAGTFADLRIFPDVPDVAFLADHRWKEA